MANRGGVLSAVEPTQGDLATMVGQPPPGRLKGSRKSGERLAKFSSGRLGRILGRHVTAVELVKHILPALGGVVVTNLPVDGIETNLAICLIGVVTVKAVTLEKWSDVVTWHRHSGRLVRLVSCSGGNRFGPALS